MRMRLFSFQAFYKVKSVVVIQLIYYSQLSNIPDI